MIQAQETHERIIKIITEKGPSLPINIAKDLEMSSLFTSAFLSELANQKRIKVSNLKVGGSPLYFLEGQEEKLEPYYKYFHSREADAFLSLREKQVLKDSEQEPAIRVALRSIKDFAREFNFNNEIYWHYILIPESQAREMIQPKKEEVEETKKEKQELVPMQELVIEKRSVEKPKEESKERSKPQQVFIKQIENKENKFKNPLIIPEKTKRQKPKSEFVQKTIEFIKRNNLQIIEEKDYKAKEYNCVVRVRSELGSIDFFTQAKDKKTITETDFKKILSIAQSIPLPAFILYTGEISKKAKEYLKRYSSVLKAKKLTF